MPGPLRTQLSTIAAPRLIGEGRIRTNNTPLSNNYFAWYGVRNPPWYFMLLSTLRDKAMRNPAIFLSPVSSVRYIAQASHTTMFCQVDHSKLLYCSGQTARASLALVAVTDKELSAKFRRLRICYLTHIAYLKDLPGGILFPFLQWLYYIRNFLFSQEEFSCFSWWKTGESNPYALCVDPFVSWSGPYRVWTVSTFSQRGQPTLAFHII